MILMCCSTPRRSFKPSVPSITENKTPASSLAAENLSIVKLEDASPSLEFTGDHSDMTQYVSLLYHLLSQF